MDALFENKTAQFFEAANHIALYKEKVPSGWSSWIDSIFLENRMQPQHYEYCNVPGLGDTLGKKVPADVHGYYTFVDVAALQKQAGLKHGVVKFTIKAQANRCREGGRRFYDLCCLNFVIAGTAIGSMLFLRKGLAHWNWMYKHPILALAATYGFTIAGGPAFKMMFNEMGFGLFFAERSHMRSIKGMKCVDCLEDINEYTQQEAREIRNKKGSEGLPKAPPGMPQADDALGLEKKQLKENAKTANMLEREVDQIKALIRKSTRENCAKCEVHTGLREDPDGYNHPNGWPIWDMDRKVISERMLWERALEDQRQIEGGAAEIEQGLTDEEKKALVKEENYERAKKMHVKYV